MGLSCATLIKCGAEIVAVQAEGNYDTDCKKKAKVEVFQTAAGQNTHLNPSSECDRHVPPKKLFKEAENNPLLTRQVLSSPVTIRLGGGCAAPRRQIKLTLTAVFESPIPQSINEGRGDSGVLWPL